MGPEDGGRGTQAIKPEKLPATLLQPAGQPDERQQSGDATEHHAQEAGGRKGPRRPLPETVRQTRPSRVSRPPAPLTGGVRTTARAKLNSSTRSLVIPTSHGTEENFKLKVMERREARQAVPTSHLSWRSWEHYLSDLLAAPRESIQPHWQLQKSLPCLSPAGVT